MPERSLMLPTEELRNELKQFLDNEHRGPYKWGVDDIYGRPVEMGIKVTEIGGTLKIDVPMRRDGHTSSATLVSADNYTAGYGSYIGDNLLASKWLTAMARALHNGIAPNTIVNCLVAATLQDNAKEALHRVRSMDAHIAIYREQNRTEYIDTLYANFLEQLSNRRYDTL